MRQYSQVPRSARTFDETCTVERVAAVQARCYFEERFRGDGFGMTAAHPQDRRRVEKRLEGEEVRSDTLRGHGEARVGHRSALSERRARAQVLRVVLVP